MTRRSTRAATVAVWTAAISLVALTGAPAGAHTELRGATPSEGARLTTAPAQLELRFTEDISADFAQVSLLRGGSQQRLDASVRGPVVTAEVPLPPTGLESGRIAWKVSYRVVSADGHPITGTVRFTAPSGGSRGTGSSSSPTTSESRTGSAADDAPTPAANDPDGNGSSLGVVGIVAVAATALLVTVAAVVVAVRRRIAPPGE